MVAEVVYDYQPIVPVSLITTAFGKLTIRRLVAFNVRERNSYSLRNDGNLTGAKRADCQLYSAAAPTVIPESRPIRPWARRAISWSGMVAP